MRPSVDRGIEFTTFSLAGRCERTGMLGVAIATSEMAVGSRCIHVAPGVGAVTTQPQETMGLGPAKLGGPRHAPAHVLAPGEAFGEREVGLPGYLCGAHAALMGDSVVAGTRKRKTR